MHGSPLRAIAVRGMNRSRFGNRAIALSVIVAAIAPRLAIASSDAAPKSDPVTRCDDRLRIEIRSRGVSFLAGRRPVGPGCTLDLPGTTFPGDADSEDDVPALRRCAERLRRELPALARARSVDLRAAADVRFRRVKAVMSALGKTDEHPALLPDVSFGPLQ